MANKLVIMFLQAVDISGKYKLDKGTCLPAEECDNYIAIHMPDDFIVMAPKSAIGDIFNIIIEE